MEGQKNYRGILEQFNDFFMFAITAIICVQNDTIDDQISMNAEIEHEVDVAVTGVWPPLFNEVTYNVKEISVLKKKERVIVTYRPRLIVVVFNYLRGEMRLALERPENTERGHFQRHQMRELCEDVPLYGISAFSLNLLSSVVVGRIFNLHRIEPWSELTRQVPRSDFIIHKCMHCTYGNIQKCAIRDLRLFMLEFLRYHATMNHQVPCQLLDPAPFPAEVHYSITLVEAMNDGEGPPPPAAPSPPPAAPSPPPPPQEDDDEDDEQEEGLEWNEDDEEEMSSGDEGYSTTYSSN